MGLLEKAKLLPPTADLTIGDPEDTVGYAAKETILGALFLSVQRKDMPKIKQPIIVVKAE
jgi:hypothetical protein